MHSSGQTVILRISEQVVFQNYKYKVHSNQCMFVDFPEYWSGPGIGHPQVCLKYVVHRDVPLNYDPMSISCVLKELFQTKGEKISWFNRASRPLKRRVDQNRNATTTILDRKSASPLKAYITILGRPILGGKVLVVYE